MNNTYLCHHGIKGQKWGVRRFEDEDGTLTEAGKERYNNDSNSLARSLSKHVDADAKYYDSVTKHYFVDKNGNNRVDDKGNGIFDVSKYVYTHDTKKLSNAERAQKEYLNLKSKMQKKYAEVVANAELNEQGKSYVSVKLTDKLGNVYVTKLETEYKDLNFERTKYVKR